MMKPAAFILFLVFCKALVYAQEPLYDKIFFENSPMSKSFFYSEAKYTSPSWVNNVSGKLPVSDSIFFTPGNALCLNYVSLPKGKWQVNLLTRSVRGQEFITPATILVFRFYVTSATMASQKASWEAVSAPAPLCSCLCLSPFALPGPRGTSSDRRCVMPRSCSSSLPYGL